MKYIVKGDAPPSFQSWTQKNPGANWDEFASTVVYQELKQGLINEQGNLCCYCELAIRTNSDAHIEHHKPQNRYHGDMFSIENLFACCKHNDCCGHNKGSEYFNELISPLHIDCQTRFTYTGNGKIIPADEHDQFAQKTIDLLELNCKRLKTQRESIIKMLDNNGSTHSFLQQYLDNCVEWCNGFFTVIQYVTNKLFPVC